MSQEPGGAHLDTRLARLGGAPADRQGAVNPPVYRASTFVFPTVAEYEASREHEHRFDTVRYGQLGTPTTFALEEAIAGLEGGYRAMLLPSGLAAVTVTLQALLSAGDHLLMVDTAYGPTRHFCDQVLRRFGIETTYYVPTLGAGIAELVKDNTRVVFLESPGSLTFEVQDIPAIVRAARARGLTSVIDNSWATPYYLPAMALGVDLSVIAATKYIGGHADVMLGTVTTTEALYERIRSHVAETGFCVGSDDAYLALRGLRTLSVRLERHQRNALKVAEWLQARPEVDRVLYPALPHDPGHAIWKRDFRGASGLLGVALKPISRTAVHALLNALRIFQMGVSFGGYESLAIPIFPSPLRTAQPWTAETPLVRLHVGLEDSADLIADLEYGFAQLGAVAGQGATK
ncbi:MAG: cystathionine beta-lyase [Gemmatimonadota bacterium]